jgi:hypothetical protein
LYREEVIVFFRSVTFIPKFYTRIRPALVEGKVILKADTKKKDGGTFEGLAY